LDNGDNRKEGEEKRLPILPNKDRVYQYVANNPGCHLRRISKDLDLAMGDTQYHLKNLEKSNLIKSRLIGVFRTYYSVSIYGERMQSILAMLRQEVPRDIILFLIENPGASQAEIAQHQTISAPAINWHMTRLIEIGLVSSHRQGKFVNYYIEGNIKDVTSILRKYYPSVWSRLSNRLADLFLDVSSESRFEMTNKDNVKGDNEKKQKELDKGEDNYKLWY
jgi:predicted transcriptional regulator